MNYNMTSLSKEDGKVYIRSRLREAGCHQTIFDEPAFEAIVGAANGIPRNINKICDMCLVLGDAQNLSQIDSEIVITATNEIELS